MNTLPASLANLRQHLQQAPAPAAAWAIVEEYFHFIKPAGFQQQLWVLTVGLLTNDEMQQAEKGRQRHDIIFFFEFTLAFAEAVHYLYRQHSISEAGQAGRDGP
jgi:hypothetical protein